ncbi:MAG: efflux RND transporter permease subunit [Planctomycetota bacterium]
MKAFVQMCLRRPITTLTMHITLLIMGLIALDRLPLNSTPEADRPRIRVTIPYPEANPEQVEEEVTRKVEEALATLRGIKQLSAESRTGEGTVSAEFEWGTNIDQVKLEVRERLARIRHELPVEDLERITIRGAWNNGDAVIRGRVSALGIDLSENYELLVDRLRRPLERIEGVAQVEMDGVTPLEIQVTLQQDELDRHGIVAADLLAQLEDNNIQRTVGEVMRDGQRRRLRVVHGFRSVDDVRAFPVNERGLRLDQVADVSLRDGEVRFGRHLNQRFAVSLEVFKESTANTVEVCARVLERIRELERDPQLAGIDLLVWENQGAMILDALGGLRDAGVLGSAFAMLILYFFLRRLSATILVGMSIPISVLFALAALHGLGKDLNILTLVALMLGVGMLVDTAVVVVESIVRLTSQGRDVQTASVQGTMEVATPIFSATITSIIVFLPVAFGQPSSMNDYIAELGVVISLTLAASLFVSLTLIPMVSARIYRPGERDPGQWFLPVQRAYRRLLERLIAAPVPAALGTLAAVGSVVLPISWGFEFELSDVDEIENNVGVFYRPEASLDFVAMERYVNEVEAALIPHRERLGFHDIYSWYKDNFAWTAIYPENRTLDADGMAALRVEIDKVLPTIPGVSVKTGNWGMYFGGGGRRGSAGDLLVRVFGESSGPLDALLHDLEGRFRGLPGVLGVERRFRDAVDEITVTPDAERIARHGLSSQALSRQVQAGFGRSFLREIRNPEGDLRLRVAFADAERDSLPELESLAVRLGGSELPLAAVSDIAQGEGPGERRRENRQSSLSLSVSFDPREREVVRAGVAETLQSYDWPRGYSFDLGQSWRQQGQNRDQFGLGVLLAVFLVYLVMCCLFESLLQPLVLLLTVILAIPGVIWFLFLCGDSFDVPASVGTILLVGIVVNNGIVMIDHFNRYRARGFDLREAVLQGGEERLRPVLITALTTIIGLSPLAIGQAQAAGVYYFTLARTIVGGLAISTLLTLLVLPLGYMLVSRWARPRSAREREAAPTP